MEKILYDLMDWAGIEELVYSEASDPVAKVKSDDSWYSFIENSGESHYNEKIKELYSKSLYHSDYEFGYDDELLTLSTCEYSQNDGRLIVVAVKEGANSNV